MPLYAGVCETNITPPVGAWMSGYALRPCGGTSVHDELFARALVLDNGRQRVALLSCDLIALDTDIVARVRAGIASQIDARPEAILLNCTHTHAGPYVYRYRAMGYRDEPYIDVLCRKLVGVAAQAAAFLQPAHLTYGEASTQIGVNRRQSRSHGDTVLGADYAGPVDPRVQTLAVNAADGRTFALLFSHACHPTTVGGENLAFSAEWPGAAVAALKRRFQAEGAESGVGSDALAFCLQGCCGDINPIRRGSWAAVEENGRLIAEAAHTARWNAHGHLDDTLDAAEEVLSLPLAPPPPREECERALIEWRSTLERDRKSQADPGRIMFDEGRIAWTEAALEIAARPAFAETLSFSIQRLNLGGAQVLGFPGEIFVQYQLDFARQCRAPVFSLAYTNGCWNYVPTAAEFARGGYEVLEAHKYYGTLMVTPDCEPLIRDAVYRLLDLDEPDITPYALEAGRARG